MLDYLYYILDCLYYILIEIPPVVSVIISALAIGLAYKSRTILKGFKADVEVFFEKERMLQGYNHHIELFKPIVRNPEDIEIIKRDIIKFQLDIKKIFSEESNHQIYVYDCNWNDIQKNNHQSYRYTLRIIKENHRKNMPEIHYPNEKMKIGQYGFLVKVIEGNNFKLLSKEDPYFIYFRLSGFREQNTNIWKPQGFWLVTKTIDKNNTKYPFLFISEPNKSFSLTADEFMKKKKIR